MTVCHNRSFGITVNFARPDIFVFLLYKRMKNKPISSSALLHFIKSDFYTTRILTFRLNWIMQPLDILISLPGAQEMTSDPLQRLEKILSVACNVYYAPEPSQDTNKKET